MSEAVLLINGIEHAGWTSVSVSRAIDRMAATFTLSLTDRWEALREPRPILPHAAATVTLDGEPILTGFIDNASPDYDRDGWTVSVSGRSRTAQMVDCDAVYGSGEIAGLDLVAIATALGQPYGVRPTFDADPGAVFPLVRVEPGETGGEVIERLARQRRLWVSDTGNGSLRFLRASGGVQAVLKGPLNGDDGEGIDILKASGAFNGSEQFSDYTIKGQTIGSDGWDGSVSATAAATAGDASVPIHRPKTILTDTDGDSVSLRERAIHEAALRRGRSRQVVYTLPGWHRPDGRLWDVGRAVEVRDRIIGVADPLLVVGTDFIRSEEDGVITRLTVAEQDAYALLAATETKPVSTLWRDT